MLFGPRANNSLGVSKRIVELAALDRAYGEMGQEQVNLLSKGTIELGQVRRSYRMLNSRIFSYTLFVRMMWMDLSALQGSVTPAHLS